MTVVVEFTWPDSSSKTWSYSLSATQKMIDVTASKQWIHFFRSDRCPPTSNILFRVAEDIIKNPVSTVVIIPNNRRHVGGKLFHREHKKKKIRTVYWVVPCWTSFLKFLSSLIVPVTHLVHLVCSRRRLSCGLDWRSYSMRKQKKEKQKVLVDVCRIEGCLEDA